MILTLRGVRAPMVALAVVALFALFAAPKPASAGPKVYKVSVPIIDGDNDDSHFLHGQLSVYPDGSAYLTARGYVDEGDPDDAGPLVFSAEELGGIYYYLPGPPGALYYSTDWEEGITAEGYVVFYAVLYRAFG